MRDVLALELLSGGKKKKEEDVCDVLSLSRCSRGEKKRRKKEEDVCDVLAL